MSPRATDDLIQVGGVKASNRQPAKSENSPERLASVLLEQHGAPGGIRLAMKLAKHAADQGDPQQEQFWRDVADVMAATERHR